MPLEKFLCSHSTCSSTTVRPQTTKIQHSRSDVQHHTRREPSRGPRQVITLPMAIKCNWAVVCKFNTSLNIWRSRNSKNSVRNIQNYRKPINLPLLYSRKRATWGSLTGYYLMKSLPSNNTYIGAA